MVVEADIDHRRTQRERLDHLCKDGGNADRRIRLTVSYFAEQNIVLNRRRRIVTLRIEELDLLLYLRRKTGAKYFPRPEEPLLHRLVEHVEPMTRRDQLERQRQEL